MNFIFFSTILWDWAGGVHQSTQVSLEVARRGHHVLFIQPRASITRQTFDLPIRILSLGDLGLSDSLAERAWYGLDVGSLDGVGSALLGAVDAMELPGEQRIAIWFSPFDPFARLLPLVRGRGYHPVYYPQDDFSAMAQLGFHRPNKGAEDYLGSEAELILTLSQPVAQKMLRFGKDVCVIPDGIDLAEFRGESPSSSPDVLRGERTLGFWGWISNAMVDAGTLAYIARARPKWAINLVGGVETHGAGPDVQEQLKEYANIRFHGEVEHRRLKDYAPFFEACLIPAPDNDFSRGRDPIKVYEYLSAHKPVISTNMPQLSGMPYVRNASTPQGFLEEIEAAFVTPVDVQMLDDFLAKQTWAERVDSMLEVVGRLGEREPAAALLQTAELAARPAIAESFAHESPGVQTYINQLETDLAETRRWARDLEAAVISKDRQLKRLYDLWPVRIVRRLAHFFRPDYPPRTGSEPNRTNSHARRLSTKR